MTPRGRYVECRDEFDGDGRALFLAGGITGCPDWQAELQELLKETTWTLLNPRRVQSSAIDWNDEAQSRAQIEWEFDHLRRASAILFWFPAESVCPITLFELGAWSMTSKPLIVGTSPAYSRRFDVITQLRLARPDVTVYSSLAEAAAAFLDFERRLAWERT